MSLSQDQLTIDQSRRELIEHGTQQFPVAYYHDNLQNSNVPWHWHEELEVVILIEGSAVVSVGNEKYTLSAGDGAFINSGILHAFWSKSEEPCLFHSLVFHPYLVGGSGDSVFYQKYILPVITSKAFDIVIFRHSDEQHKSALKFIEDSWKSCAASPLGYEFTVRENLSNLIFLLYQNNNSACHSVPLKAARNNERMKLMLQYIHIHYADTITTKTIASQASISESECLRCFRSTIGTTPNLYLRTYRIQRACQLLRSSQDNIANIAIQCGFQDISYFTKIFHGIMGKTPSSYRKDAFSD